LGWTEAVGDKGFFESYIDVGDLRLLTDVSTAFGDFRGSTFGFYFIMLRSFSSGWIFS
jgi:hypothetical protein